MSCALFSMCGIRRSKSVEPGLCLWAPTKPKFLDRLITSRGLSGKKFSENRAGKKRGRHLLTNQESTTDRSDQSEDEEEGADFVSSGSTDNEGATGYFKLLPDCGDPGAGPHHVHGLTCAQSEPCSPVLDRDHRGFSDRDVASSPPLSPILSGLVKQRCESYKRFYRETAEAVSERVPFVSRARSQDRGFPDSPRARRGFSPAGEKADRWIKGYYSLSRDESFSKAVMEKGYVRALAEQINTGTLPPSQTEGEDDDNSEKPKDAEEERDGDEKGSPEDNGDSRSTNNQEEGSVECSCPKASDPPQDKNKKGGKSLPPGSDGSMNAADGECSQPPSLHQSMSPCQQHCCCEDKAPSKKEKRVWSPRSRRKHSTRPRSPPPAIPTNRGAKDSNSQPPSKCSTPEPRSPRSPKSLRTKPPVDHSTKPKLPKPVNGVSGKSPEKSPDASSAPKMASSPGENGSSVGEEKGGDGGAYVNVFFSPGINPQELFDMSWSSSESEFTDSDGEEDSLTVQQVKELGEPPSTPKDKLHQIALELLTTERAYVQRLNLLQNVFYYRIDQENRTQAFLPGDTLTQMFSSIQSIHQFHNDFLLKEVEERMKNWESERRIGDLMKKNAPFLKLYTAYVKNFDNAMTLINYWLEKSQKFATMVKEIQKLPECGCLTLQHHMLGPIQRVPRYELLLKDYLKHLPEESPDRPDAQAALGLVTTAARHSNEAMKKIEKFHRLLDIYQRLRGVAVDFISPTRDFVREGPITKISARSGEKQSRYLFLFNDLLLICSEPLVGAYRVRAQLDVDGMEVKHGDNLAIPNTFLVHSKQKAIELLEEQPGAAGNTWLESLKQVIEDLRSKKWSFSTVSSPTEHQETTPGKQAPRWIPDDAVTMCMLCEVVFNTFRRRHHCRACGKLICKNCCKKAPLEYMNNKLERVCRECHDAIVFAGRGSLQSPSRSGKRKILGVKADDPGLLAGYLSISDDVGRTWNKRWFSLHEDFVMYFFKARQDVSAYHSLPVPGYHVETVSDTEKPNTLRVYHHSINKRGILFQADNDKILKKWVNVLGKLALAQLPDDSQRLSSQSNSSSASSGSDNNPTTTLINNNNNNNTTSGGSSNSDKLSQADSGFTQSDSVCEDSVTELPPTLGDDEVGNEEESSEKL
ncbi:hypothetical protein ACOMHN_022271 [Nucella lapillus]